MPRRDRPMSVSCFSLSGRVGGQHPGCSPCQKGPCSLERWAWPPRGWSQADAGAWRPRPRPHVCRAGGGEPFSAGTLLEVTCALRPAAQALTGRRSPSDRWMARPTRASRGSTPWRTALGTSICQFPAGPPPGSNPASSRQAHQFH